MINWLNQWLRQRAARKTNSPGNVLMHANPAYAAHTVGRWTYGFPKIYHWDEGARLSIGNYCSFADDTAIFLGGNHRVDWITTHPISLVMPGLTPVPGHPATKGDINIGHDVWMGNGAAIMSGVTIGTGAVIGARAVVSRDVPPYAIVVGNPATVVKFRFNPQQIEQLLAIAWWLWPDEQVRAEVTHLQSARIDEFIARHGRPGPPAAPSQG